MTSAIKHGPDLAAHASFGTCADCGGSICDPLGYLQPDAVARCVDCVDRGARAAIKARDARTRCAVTSNGTRCVKPHHSDGVHTDGHATWVDGDAEVKALLAATMRAMSDDAEAERSGASPLASEPVASPSAFHTALADLAKNAGPRLALPALVLWHRICAALTPPEPMVMLGADSDHIRFVWRAAKTYLDIEAHRDGTYEWFCHVDGQPPAGTEDDRHAEVPGAFFDCLRALTAAVKS